MHPGFAPVVIFFVVLLALFGGFWAIQDFGSFVTILKWGLILIGGGWFLSAIFPQSETSSSGDQPLHTYDAWGELQSGHVEHIDRNTKIIHAEGIAFEVTNRFNGQPMVREVDPSSKASKSRWTYGEQRSISNHIKYVVNTRKGRGGN